MELSKINANLLVALDLLLDEGNVARAAERSGVSASAMSHTLRSLRELFGDPLLIRTSHGMAPTPLAQSLKRPLRRAVRDLERAISSGLEFDPGRSERGFVVIGPDFVTTLLLSRVAPLLVAEAPGIDIEVRPVQRHGGALRLSDVAQLAEGDVDLVLAAVLSDIAGIQCEPLYPERFVCLVRHDHPQIGEALDLQTYASLPHLLITITDERTPSWIDEELAKVGLSRRVALRTRYFMAAPAIVAESDLIVTCPYQLARHFASHLPLRILEPPLALPRYREFVGWHQRFESDPALRWLRALFRRAAAELIVDQPDAS